MAFKANLTGLAKIREDITKCIATLVLIQTCDSDYMSQDLKVAVSQAKGALFDALDVMDVEL